MNKSELASAIADKAGVSIQKAENMVNACMAAITEALSSGDSVTLVGFGVFEPVARRGRVGRNPATGASIRIPDKIVPKFRPGKALVDSVGASNA